MACGLGVAFEREGGGGGGFNPKPKKVLQPMWFYHVLLSNRYCNNKRLYRALPCFPRNVFQSLSHIFERYFERTRYLVRSFFEVR